MTYKKIGFRDRLDSNPTTYLIDGETKEIIKDNSGVSEEGTSLNASNFNHLEDGILQNSRDVEVLNREIKKNNSQYEEMTNEIGNIKDLKTTNKDNLVESVNELFINVDNGKSSLYSAIVGKKVTPRSKDFKDLTEAITDIKLGQGNAQVSQVLSGRTFTNDSGIMQTGTMPNMGNREIEPKTYVQELGTGYYNNIKVKGINDLDESSCKNIVDSIKGKFPSIVGKRFKCGEINELDEKKSYVITVGFKPSIVLMYATNTMAIVYYDATQQKYFITESFSYSKPYYYFIGETYEWRQVRKASEGSSRPIVDNGFQFKAGDSSIVFPKEHPLQWIAFE